MQLPLASFSLTLLTLVALPQAHAQSTPWSFRTGLAAVNFAAQSRVDLGGAVVPGGEVQFQNNTALAMEIGYAVSDRWVTRFAFGTPPTTTMSVGGSLKSAVPPLTGTLGRVKYAPAVLSLTYRVGDFEGFCPYIGAGINYTWVVSAHDADVAGLKVESAWGSALQAGFDVPLNSRWSLFFDVRKIFIKTSATGSVPAMGGPSAKAYVTLDPLITQIGVGYRF